MCWKNLSALNRSAAVVRIILGMDHVCLHSGAGQACLASGWLKLAYMGKTSVHEIVEPTLSVDGADLRFRETRDSPKAGAPFLKNYHRCLAPYGLGTTTLVRSFATFIIISSLSRHHPVIVWQLRCWSSLIIRYFGSACEVLLAMPTCSHILKKSPLRGGDATLELRILLRAP